MRSKNRIPKGRAFSAAFFAIPQLVGHGAVAGEVDGLAVLLQRAGLERANKDSSIDEAAWHSLASRMRYVRGDLNDPELYKRIGQALERADAEHQTEGNSIF